MRIKKKRQWFLLFLITFLLSSLLVFGTSRAWFKRSTWSNPISVILSPLERILATPRFFISTVVLETDTLIQTYEQNKLLKKKVNELEAMLIEKDTLLKKNQSLRAALDLEEAYSSFALITADVFSREPSTWSDTLRISRGSNDGIGQDDLALANGGVVGIVSQVDSDRSDITLLTNIAGSEQLSVKIIGQVSVYAILSTYDEKENVYILTQLTADTEIKVGSSVVTSDLSNRYVGNFPIGEVISVKKDINSLETTVYVRPAATFDSILTVDLVTKESI